MVTNSEIQKYLLNQNLTQKSLDNIVLKHTEARSYTHRIKVEVYIQLWNRDGQSRKDSELIAWGLRGLEKYQNTERRSGQKKKKAKGLLCQYELYNLFWGDNSGKQH